MEADIDGHQRKVMRSAVRPARSAYGTEGIALEDGRTVPFVVSRGWNAPAGRYLETWYLVDPDTNEVVFEGPVRMEAKIWGLQSITDVTDEVRDEIPLGPGRYKIVFALGGVRGGEIEVEAREVGSEQAA
jgi:hypothetical protein